MNIECSGDMPQALLVMVTLPDLCSAETLAHALVDNRLAACVHVQSPVTSVYRWHGKVETAREVPLFIKTVAGCYAQLEEFILQRHPAETPEIIAVTLTQGLPAYLRWLADETCH